MSGKCKQSWQDMPNRLRFLAALGMAVSACGGTSTADRETSCPIANHVGCAQPRGTYHITYNERRGGTCGGKPATDVEATNVRVTRFNAPCLGNVTWSSDFCTASFEVSCPEEETGPGFTNKQVSHTSYTDDAMIGTGVLELSIFARTTSTR